ncbi:Transcription factor, MADS-box [Dillenia turbinata]|uniref:Transcription factor, MADS-box n=1 Tax=Dillenia turbinata TaxID=194707 RepID=A0AAN8ZPZ8_9MAGN
MARRPTSGRKKIPIAKIENKDRLQVTFSKRKSGLFKKASELSILCGVEMAIVLFSPTGKVYSFGNPDVNSIANRFLREKPPPQGSSDAIHMVEARRIAKVHELNMELEYLLNQLEVEKKRGKALDEMLRTTQSQTVCEIQRLEQQLVSLEELKKNIDKPHERYGIGT